MLWVLVSAAAGVAADPKLGELDLRVGGYVDAGRFQLADSAANGEILSRLGARWRIDKELGEHWTVTAHLHWLFWRNQLTSAELFHVKALKFDSDMEGVASYHAGVQRARMGLYAFKYNPDSKNLGEYLLRSEAYPTIVESSQGKDLLAYSYARVMGGEYGLEWPAFRPRVLLYAEQYNMPVNDLNLVFLAAAGPRRAEVEVGASLHRFAKLGKKINDNGLDPALRQYVEDNGLDTKAVKLMARGRLDLGAMLGLESGFRLYAETALLGLKNDTLYYKSALERMPMMFGIDIPTFGLLDMLGFEAEYFGNPYYGRKYPIKDATGSNFSPLPYLDPQDYGSANLPDHTRDDFKWSVYAHKGLNRWIDLKLRVASDHFRLLNWDGDFEGGSAMTRGAGDWYILARIEYHN